LSYLWNQKCINKSFFKYFYVMRLPIPEHIKSAVIDAWLMGGKTRDEIASEFNISTGSVSNIKQEWQNRIGVFEAKNLRELGLALKKAGITPIQCVEGLRITNIIKQLGIDDDHLFDFLNKLYNESKEQRSLPADIIRLVKFINAYPEEINSLNDIPKNIEKRRQEKTKLDADIFYKKLEIQKLDHEKERKRKEIQDLQDDLEAFRKKTQNEKKDFLLFKNVKEELKKHSIDIHVLDPLIDVIKIFADMNFRPLTILSEFSDRNAYRDLVENKDREIKQRESHKQDLKAICDNYEMKISLNEPIVQSLKQMEDLGFTASDIKNLHLIFSEISKKYRLNKKEIKIRFFRCMNYYFNDLFTLQQDIFEKQNEVTILDDEISLKRKIIKESQPIVFSILQNLINTGLNEHDILMVFKVFETDLCNNMIYDNRTYLERLSKDLNKYPSVRDTLEGLNNKILLKKSYIEKLAIVKSNLEAFLFSLVITIYFYSTILTSQQVQVQKNFIKRILLIGILNYYVLPLFFIVIKEPKNSVRSKFKIVKKNNNKKKRRKEKVVTKKKLQ
jgi:hypothetical protein